MGLEDLIKAIVIGPNSKQNIEDLKWYLNKINLPRLADKVRKSDCPFRLCCCATWTMCCSPIIVRWLQWEPVRMQLILNWWASVRRGILWWRRIMVLETMLFLGHSAATAVNAGKVAFTEKNYGNRKRYLMRW